PQRADERGAEPHHCRVVEWRLPCHAAHAICAKELFHESDLKGPVYLITTDTARGSTRTMPTSSRGLTRTGSEYWPGPSVDRSTTATRSSAERPATCSRVPRITTVTRLGVASAWLIGCCSAKVTATLATSRSTGAGRISTVTVAVRASRRRTE